MKWPSVILGIKFWLVLLAWTVCSVVNAQTGSVVTVNADKVLVLNGRKVFPIGFSPGPPTNGRTPSGKDAMQELRDAGALLFRMTQTGDWDSQMIANQQAAMDWAAEHGMYCWLNLRELSKFAAGDAATEAELRSVVNLFKNHPALGVWKNFDEAWWGGVSVADLQRGYDVIKQEDTNHPVVQTHAPRGTLSDLQPYNVATDVLALDIYPVGYPPGANSLLSNKEISMAGDYTDFLAQVGNGEKQCWMIEQIAWSGATPPNKTLRFPTFTQSRYMAYQAIVNGARGLMFFGGNNAATLNPQDAPLGWNWTFWDRVLRRVVLELGDYGALAPALVATNSALPITLGGTTTPDIEFCVREAAPYLYILACKREGATIQVTFSGLPSTATTGELLYECPRTVTAQNGSFTDWYGPFDVHAYRFTVTNQPSGPIAFITQPVSRTNEAGTTATFSVSVTGSDPQFQWRKNEANLADGGHVSGATTATITLANVLKGDAGSYSVFVTNQFNSVTSLTATLEVIDPAMTHQPAGQNVPPGGTAIFTIGAAGTPPMGYRWKKGAFDLSDGGNISGASTPTLTLSAVSSADAASYSAVVSNPAGSVTSAPAALAVLFPMPYYEPFSYPAGANLGGQTNWNLLTWSDVGTATAGPYVTNIAGNLEVTGLPAATGNSIRFGGLGKSARLSFAPGSGVTSGTLYYSFILKVFDTTGLSSSGKFIAGFNNTMGTQTGQPTVVGTRVYIRTATGGFNLGVAKNSSSSTDWVWDSRVFTNRQVIFVVGGYTLNLADNSDDLCVLWLDPGASSFGSATAPAPTLTATTGPDISPLPIASFVFFQRDATEPAGMIADELRIGPTWASVTGLPPPMATILTGLTRLGDGAFQFAYANNAFLSGTVYASTNLTNWTPVGAATLLSPGLYRFTDPGATNYPRRFYQLRSP